MNETNSILLQMTGRALFHAPEDFNLATVDWYALYQEASHQALTLLIWDAFRDEECCYIPDEVSSTWERHAMLHMRNNEQLLYEQKQVVQDLADSGIPCVILKGSASAANYPNPSLRLMGDIDILVRPEQQKAAVDVLQMHGYGEVLDKNHSCHMSISKNNVTVEVHKEPNGLFLNDHAECLKKIRTYLYDTVDRRQFIGGIPVPSDEQQALILILHKLAHFMTSGLGLRQLCDWAVFAENKDEQRAVGKPSATACRVRSSHLHRGYDTRLCGILAVA
ncbi:MAG: nucleotidyltransferase family protein [Oscillospiraceae bacterium]|nr:nucleotidyltransferase family protein [Oscillospiraceae bacterium]